MKKLLLRLGKALFPIFAKMALIAFMRSIDTVEERVKMATELAGKFDLPGDFSEEEEARFIQGILRVTHDDLLVPLTD